MEAGEHVAVNAEVLHAAAQEVAPGVEVAAHTPEPQV
jgi:hypothetical protein